MKDKKIKIQCSKCGKESNDDKVCSSCGYFFKEIKKLSFKERIMRASPEQLKRVEMIGYIGNIIGTTIVIILFIFLAKSMWWVIFAFIFSILIQISNLISVIQQLEAMKNMSEIFKKVDNMI